ncbi:hypothetical protein MRB53_025945 [Persea americana]|uniref:Uncharacterized protein n=1 Tax=Persea americana TaxID=3435 RepID=A0ACC2LHU6_PERAE|nr:hypothetical protein MRB53_025945 [Persea americana]
MQFLMGLNDSCAAVRGQILLMDPMPTINKVFSLVIQEEGQREIGTTNPRNAEAAAFLNKSIPPSNEYDNIKRNQGQRRERPTCRHCGKLGHTIDKCFILHGFPPGHRLHKNSRTPSANQVFTKDKNDEKSSLPVTPYQCKQLLALLSLNNAQPMAHQAAVSHLTSLGSSSVKLPNGNFAPISHIGTVTLSPSMTLKNVDLSSRMMIGAGKEQNGLYHFQSINNGAIHSVAAASSLNHWR